MRKPSMTRITALLVALIPLAVTGFLVVVEQAVHSVVDSRFDTAIEHVGAVAAQLPADSRTEGMEGLVAAALTQAGIPGDADIEVREEPRFEGPALAIDVRVPWSGVLEIVPHPDLLQHHVVVGLGE